MPRFETQDPELKPSYQPSEMNSLSETGVWPFGRCEFKFREIEFRIISRCDKPISDLNVVKPISTMGWIGLRKPVKTGRWRFWTVGIEWFGNIDDMIMHEKIEDAKMSGKGTWVNWHRKKIFLFWESEISENDHIHIPQKSGGFLRMTRSRTFPQLLWD
jgi:hypothetical protein